MIELKFRAWDKRNVRFQWGISNICLTLGGNLMWQFGFDAPSFLDREECDNYVLCQYTGLKDKNGKEIYEGDIIKFERSVFKDEEIRIVTWDNEYAGFDPFIYNICPDYSKMTNIKIIGNVYENSELMK